MPGKGLVSTEIPAGVKITKPAQELLAQHPIDPGLLPIGPIITEATVRALLSSGSKIGASSEEKISAPILSGAFDPTRIVVYGGGGHGKSVIELLRSLNTYEITGVLDDGIRAGETVLGIPVLGGAEKLTELYNDGVRMAVNAVGGIGKLDIRLEVFRRLHEARFSFPSSVHPTAFVEASARLAAGVQAFPLAYIGSEAEVGFGCIVNTGAIVSHDCKLGDVCNLSPGATLAGGVEVGSGALIGMRATVNLFVKIGKGARVGNGATVKADVPQNGIVPAGSVWPR
jgi:sugar O-acyltransferase (sialic acid O-acetyltransferase NeuD family)